MCVVDVVPPTVFLPPLKLLGACTDKEISYAIASLRHIYLPEVRGSSRRRHERHSGAADTDPTPVPRSHPTTLDSYNIKEHSKKSTKLSEIRADAFERTFAIQWLTRFVSLFSEAVVVAADSAGFLGVSSETLEEAASLLAVCAGSAASGTVTRTFTFPLSSDFGCGEGNGISVVLRDAPLESGDFSSVGVQTWGGSCILAEMIAEKPQNFSIYPKEGVGQNSQWLDGDAPFRALELGAGTGLASLVLGKVLGRIRGLHHQRREQSSSESFQAAQNDDAVIATDFHPSVLANLWLNFAVNFPPRIFDSQTHVVGSSETLGLVPQMVVLPLDWSVIHSLAYPTSSPRVGSHGNQISTLGEDTTDANVRHYHSSEADTSFQSQAKRLNQTETVCDGLQYSDNDSNVQTAASPYSVAPQLDVPFDLIIGADIIYEHSQARWIRSCVERFLRKPTKPFSRADAFPIRASAAAAPGYSSSIDSSPLLAARQHPTTALFHLVIPLRQTHAVECHSVEEVFLQAEDILVSRRGASIPPQSSSDNGVARCRDEPVDSFAGSFMDPVPLQLAIIGQEDIWCDAYSDREEGEVVYRYYRIGWV